MQSRQLEIPKLGKDFVPNYGDTRSFKAMLPSSKTVTFHATISKPDSYYHNMGITFLGNTGSNDSTKRETTAAFIPNAALVKTFAQSQLGGKRAADFSDDDCKRCAFYIDSQTEQKYITSGFAEYSDGVGQDYWLADGPTPYQYQAIQKYLSSFAKAKGKLYFGDYDGQVNFIGATSDFTYNGVEVLRPGFNNPSLAYQFLKGNGQGNNGYYARDLYLYRHGMVQTYWAGDYRWGYDRMLQMLIMMIYNKNALIGANAVQQTTFGRQMSFMFPARTEFTSFTEVYRHRVPEVGGAMIQYGFPQYPFKYQTLLAFISLAFMDDLYCWESGDLNGTDPNIIAQDLILDNGYILQKYYGDGNPRRGSVAQGYNPNRISSYPTCDFTGWDYVALGCEYYAKLSTWAGLDFVITRSKLSSGGAYSSNGADQLVDRIQDRKPLAIVNSQGTRRGLLFCDGGSYPPGTSRSYDIDILGATYTLEAESGMTYYYLIDVNA